VQRDRCLLRHSLHQGRVVDPRRLARRHCSEPFGRSGRCCFGPIPSCRQYWVTRPQITSKRVHHAPCIASATGAVRPAAEPDGEPYRHAALPTDGQPAVSSPYLRRYLLARRPQQHHRRQSSRWSPTATQYFDRVGG